MCNNQYSLISTDAEMQPLYDDLKSTNLVAIDTEMDAFFAYYQKVCLLQISTVSHDYLVDPLSVNLSGLNQFFSDPNYEVIFHAGENDIPHLRKEHGLEFRRVFDTYIAASVLSYPAKSLAGLIEKHFNVILDKKYQKANWNIRPITKEMADYASSDTHYLIPLREILLKELEEKELLKTAQLQFKHVALTQMHEKVFDPDNWVKIKGSHELFASFVCNGILKAAYHWREHKAQALNIQPFRVARDSSLIKLAKYRPTNLELLRNCCPEFSNEPYWSDNANEICQVVNYGISHPTPRPLGKRNINLFSRQQVVQLNNLKKWRNKTAKDENVDPSAVFTNKILQKIVLQRPSTVEDFSVFEDIPKRSIDLYAQKVLDIIKGQ